MLKIVNLFCFYQKLSICFVSLFCKFASKVIMFQDALLFQNVIVLCYSRQIAMKVVNQVPPPFTWHICQIIVDCLSLIVTICVLNQFHGH
jgi:hypothetical protein